MNRFLKRNFNTRGLTLVELMVVVALIGILAAFASPSIYNALGRSNDRAVASEVANTMRTARNQAMSRGEPLWVTFAVADTASDAPRGSVDIWRQTGTPTATTCAEGRCAVGEICKCPLANPDCDRSARVCFTDVPRSCREGYDTNNWQLLYNVVNDEWVPKISTLSGDSELRGVAPTENCSLGLTDPSSNAVPCDMMVCLEPDGRVFNQLGTSLSALPGGPARCLGEELIAWTAPREEAVTDPDLACQAGAGDIADQREDREIKRILKISVPYNGATKVVR